MTVEYTEAKALALEGYYLFPCHTAHKQNDGSILCTCGDPKLKCTGKHPRVPFSKESTNQKDKIGKWFGTPMEPAPGIGIHLGKSHKWVLDIDGTAGMEELKQITDKYGELPNTRVVQSGSGTGRHYYFQAWVDKVHSGSLSANIHIKGNVGSAYVVAPPTIHHSGNRYSYLNRVEPTDAPEWLLNLIKTKSVCNGSSSGLTDEQITVRQKNEVPIIKLLTPEQKARLHREGDRIMGYHPVHPSENPREFSLSVIYNRWTCWEHLATGGLLELAAILSGICKCEQFSRTPSDEIRILPLSGRKFTQAIQFCLDCGIPADDLKRHISGGKYYDQ